MNIFNRWKWEPGRQYVPGSGPKYEKMLLFRGSFWEPESRFIRTPW